MEETLGGELPAQHSQLHSQPSTPSPEFLGLPARGLSDCNDSSCELPAGEILMNYKNVMRFLLRSRFCAMSSSMLPKAAWELSSTYIFTYILWRKDPPLVPICARFWKSFGTEP